MIVHTDSLTLFVFTDEHVEVYFHNVKDDQEPGWYDGRVTKTRAFGTQIEVFFEEENAASWLTIKDEQIRYPRFPDIEGDSDEGGGAVNASDDEGDFN